MVIGLCMYLSSYCVDDFFFYTPVFSLFFVLSFSWLFGQRLLVSCLRC